MPAKHRCQTIGTTKIHLSVLGPFDVEESIQDEVRVRQREYVTM